MKLIIVCGFVLPAAVASAQTNQVGTIVLESGGSIQTGTGSIPIEQGGTINLDGGGLAIVGGGSIQFGGMVGGSIQIGGGTLTVDGPSLSGGGSVSVINGGNGSWTGGSTPGSIQIIGGTLNIGGGTTINSGELIVSGSLANSATNPLTINPGSTLSFHASNILAGFGDTVLTTITLHSGGTLQNGPNTFNPLGDLVLNGGTLQSTAVEASSGQAFALKGTLTVTGNGTSTIAGQGIALGAADVTGTTFVVQNGAATVDLQVTAPLRDGGGPSWPVSQASSLTKAGAGNMVLSGVNTYTGITSVTGGTLVVDAGGSISSHSMVTVGSGARLQVDGAVGAVEVHGFLAGSGTVTTVTLHRGATLAVGNSPGLMTSTAATWHGGSSFEFEINNATGTAGTNWDLFSVSGLLDLTSIAASDRMNLIVLGPDLSNFDAGSAYSWIFARAANLGGTESWLPGLDVTDRFSIQATGFNGGVSPVGGFRVVTGAEGGWSTLSLQSVPEPSSLSLLTLTAGVFLGWIRRKKGTLRPIPRLLSPAHQGEKPHECA